MSTLPPVDPLFEKTDAELLFLAQHPELYHADLITAARRERRRRGISPDPAPPEPLPRAAYLLPYEEETGSRFWQRPALWVALLTGLLVGGILYWKLKTTTAQQAVAQQADDQPIELETVAIHVIPAFDSLTRTQIAQEMRQLSAVHRTADTTATRKYKLLAERYWKAENQSTYLLSHLNPTTPDPTLSGQTTMVIEEWRRLTKVLVYNHGLTPTLTERMDLMRRAAYLRIETLQGIKGRFQDQQPILDSYIVHLRDSATHMREALLSREKWNGHLRRATL